MDTSTFFVLELQGEHPYKINQKILHHIKVARWKDLLRLCSNNKNNFAMTHKFEIKAKLKVEILVIGMKARDLIKGHDLVHRSYKGLLN